MPSSRGVLVLGMHRAGTSLVTCGIKALGIYMGDDFVDPQFDNPRGYWEDRNVVDLNQRVLSAFGLKWERPDLLTDAQWQEPEIEAMRLEAIEHIRANFSSHPLWGFKDPRTIRLLPFWWSVLERLGVQDSYVVVIRNPLSVAESLIARQPDVFDPALAHSLWLAHMVPYLNMIKQKPFVVTDYDLLMDDPRGQLVRIGRALEIPSAAANSAEIEDFVADYLDRGLRHSQFGRLDRDFVPHLSLLVQKAYLCLSRLATDRVGPDRSPFWSEWKQIEDAARRLLANESVIPERNI
jgi:O-antigen biosynthesis protein